MSKMNLTSRGITVAQAAILIGCSESHVRLLFKMKQIRGERIGARMLLLERNSVAKYAKKEITTGRPRGSLANKKKPAGTP